MAAETAIVFAIVTGRILVLPPSYTMYLLNLNNKLGGDKSQDISNFNSFFDLQKISEHVKIMTMHDFINNVARKGLLNETLPNLSPWNSADFGRKDQGKLWEYLEKACYVKEWHPGKIFIGFNISKATWAEENMQFLTSSAKTKSAFDWQRRNQTLKEQKESLFGEIPRNERLRKFASHDREVIPYDKEFHSHKAVYFPGDYRDSHRILTHFYTYLYFADPHVDRLYKRFVRDRLHYKDEIFCIAGKIIRLIHEDSAKEGPDFYLPSKDSANLVTSGGDTNKGATFAAFHIRRGDFQYKDVRLTSESIYGNTLHLLPLNRTRILYISTDDSNSTSFDPWRKHFRIKLLSDYLERAGYHPGQGKIKRGLINFNKNYIGMIEQIICANAHTFIGTPYSTFTGYITRMRGYYRDGRYSRTFYFTPRHMNQLHDSGDIVGPFWSREFAVAHRDLDDDPRPVPVII